MSLFTPFKIFLFFSLFLTIKAQDDYTQKVMAEIEIANLEMQDDCENFANTVKSSLISNNFTEMIKVREAHREQLESVSESLRPLEYDVPPELLRNWTLLVKPGDALLTKQDWSSLVSYGVTIDEYIHTAKIHCKNDSSSCMFVKSAFETFIRTSRNQTELKKVWQAWQSLVSVNRNRFPGVVNLIKKAASRNEREDVTSYWEMLADQDSAYTIADQLWEEIKPLYFKLQNFVKERLYRFYNITDGDTEIPVYLLGSNFGDDWSEIASFILPHPQLYHEAELHLKTMNIQEIYKSAEELTQELHMGPLGSNFWSNSFFNMTFCENHLVSFCGQEHTELFTCDKISWTSYLDAFESAMDVALRNMDYVNLARTNLRYSTLDEAIKGLGSTLAIKSLRYKGIWYESMFAGNHSEANEMTELLLTALRVLPKLPYYLIGDKWRLQLLENGFDGFEESWWKFRKEYQGVKGVFNTETDFIGDSYMTSNRPYLSKFLGIILQFQFLDYYKQDWGDSNQNIVNNIAEDENFLKMLRERSSTEWPSLLSNYYSIYDLSASALLDYFAPLNNYIDSAPLEQVIVKITTTTEKPVITSTTEEIQTEINKQLFVEEDTEPPLPPKHEHVEENMEEPNTTMEHITMYIGIALLGCVVAIIAYVIISKRMKRKRTNNRRFET